VPFECDPFASDSDFQQQRLKAWQPLLTPKWVIGTFALITCVFIPIGIAIVVSSAKVREVTMRYDNAVYGGNQTSPYSYPATCTTLNPPGCVGAAATGGNSNGTSGACVVAGIDYQPSYTATDETVLNVDACSNELAFTLEDDMSAPVYFYYKLSNFYQNHRRYVKSRSDTQLSGASNPDTSTCDPWKRDNTVNEKEYYPCGLIAGSFFVDRFSVSVERNGQPVMQGKWWEESNAFQKNGIAWKSDKDDKFKVNDAMYNSPQYNGNGILGVKLPPVSDEDFIVWMRTAGLPTFKKLYRKINVDLKSGDLVRVRVFNYYPVGDFDGQKAIVLSTTSWLGGKNSFLGWAYIVVGIICAVLALAFLIKHLVSPRPLGDMRAFNWPAPAKN
jgi:hypothetical protein